MVSSRPGILLRTMSGSMALQQPGSESISVAPVLTEGHVVDQAVISHLETYRNRADLNGTYYYYPVSW